MSSEPAPPAPADLLPVVMRAVQLRRAREARWLRWRAVAAAVAALLLLWGGDVLYPAASDGLTVSLAWLGAEAELSLALWTRLSGALAGLSTGMEQALAQTLTEAPSGALLSLLVAVPAVLGLNLAIARGPRLRRGLS